MRRFEIGRAAPARKSERGRYRFSGWLLDRKTRKLTDPNGAPVPLTKGEYALLLAFLDAPQRPLSREYLLQATRVHEDVFDRSIDVQIFDSDASSNATPARRESSRLSAASDMCSPFRSSGTDGPLSDYPAGGLVPNETLPRAVLVHFARTASA